ncbi:MAG: ABC transporter permease [Dermatophilaceae bacterium]
MTWVETARTAYDAIRTRRMRSALTVLGILIGIAAVILTVGLGQGAQQRVTESINKLGSNLLIVTPGSSTSASGLRGGLGSATTLTVDDAGVLADSSVAPDIANVAPTSQTSSALVAGTSTWTTTVVGTSPAWVSVRARTVAQGRFFTAEEVTSESAVAVIGSTTASQLFTSGSPLGQSITVGGKPFTIIGVLASEGSTTVGDQDDTLVVPMSTYATKVSTSGNPRSVSQIYLEAKDAVSLSAAYQEATNALLNLHGVTTSSADFSVSSQQSIVDTATTTTRILTVLLAGIAAISLLVGGIGVMNIMLVSVTERVREIGLRKALGATPRAILRQFLVEASLLGLAGGLCGLALGFAGAMLLPNLIGQPVTISPLASVGALVVSLAIGIGAGVYPASRAARLAPIDALRSE